MFKQLRITFTANVLNDDKRTQTYAVNHLDNLNQAQKETLTHEIQQATRVSDVNNVYSKARALDSEMQNLKTLWDNKIA